MSVEYTAKRSLIASHVVDGTYTLDIDFTEAERSREVDKSIVRAFSGRTETLYHKADTVWRLTFEPVRGAERSQLKEFLDSTAGGEPFDVWVYGNEVEPITAERSDEGYTETPFMRVGERDTDLFQVSITVREIQ